MSRVPRYAGSAITGMAAALLMLWLMQLLVTSPSHRLPTVEATRMVDFVRLQREERLQRKTRTPPPPRPRQVTPPPRPTFELQPAAQPQSPRLDMVMNLDVPLDFGDGPWLGPQALLPADSSFIPLSQQPPQYPYQAAQRRIEGWVRVEFTVNESGDVEQVEVIESEPPGVFDKAAVRAVSRWRFKPRVVNGRAVAGKASQVVEFNLNQP